MPSGTGPTLPLATTVLSASAPYGALVLPNPARVPSGRTHTYFNTVAGNATWTTHTITTYDKSGRVTRITASRNTNPNDRILDVSYCYTPFVSGQPCATSNDSGLRRWQRDEITGTISVNSYDGGNRLTTYSYNAAEQMTSATANGPTSPHMYAGTSQTEMTSAAGNHFGYGRDDRYRQPWLQSYNHGAADAYVERDGRGTPLGLHSSANDFTTILDGLGSVVAVVGKDGSTAAGTATTRTASRCPSRRAASTSPTSSASPAASTTRPPA